MHEHSLTSGLLKKITSLAQEQNAQRVVAVNVTLGALCSISPDHFREHFVAAAAGTVAEDAFLNIIVNDDFMDSNAQQIMLESVEFIE
jgi:hydrogenase nickel incorporation protein HypA/HybF